MDVLDVEPIDALHGTFGIPGDKSITHRAFLFGGLARGQTTVAGANSGTDCAASLDAMVALGARVTRLADGQIQIQGTGGALREPDDVIDCGNSGTTMRLLAGIVAGLPGMTVLTGDASLRSRPMQRITEPLGRMGAVIHTRREGRAPLVIQGGTLEAIDYPLPVPSAQVKSAVLLAGLNPSGVTRVIEPVPSRDHTERMLRAFDVDVGIEPLDPPGAHAFDVGATMVGAAGETEVGEGRILSIDGGQILSGAEVRVPGDPSAAAFLLVAGLIVPDAEVVIEHVCVNPTRRGLIDVLMEMGGQIEVRGATDDGIEPVATLVARSSELRGTEIRGERIPALIDELPILAVAAAFAHGTTTVADAAELRLKESDRIQLICRNLAAAGVRVEERRDGFVVHGGARPRGTTTDAMGDHRIAMAAAVMGLAADGRSTIRGAANIATSFPDFAEQLAACGAVS